MGVDLYRVMSMAVNPASLDLPRKPGVYLFKGGDGQVNYVGKATNLRSRVGSYFGSSDKREMVPKLVSKSDDIEIIVTQNPSEALILERQLIKKYKPKYNSLLKDDKSFPYICITDEKYPRIEYTRHPSKNSRIRANL